MPFWIRCNLLCFSSATGFFKINFFFTASRMLSSLRPCLTYKSGSPLLVLHLQRLHISTIQTWSSCSWGNPWIKSTLLFFWVEIVNKIRSFVTFPRLHVQMKATIVCSYFREQTHAISIDCGYNLSVRIKIETTNNIS